MALAATLRDHWDEALLYRDLARLRTVEDGVPIRQRDPDELRWDGAPRAEWEAFCEEWGLDRLRSTAPSLAGRSHDRRRPTGARCHHFDRSDAGGSAGPVDFWTGPPARPLCDGSEAEWTSSGASVGPASAGDPGPDPVGLVSAVLTLLIAVSVAAPGAILAATPVASHGRDAARAGHAQPVQVGRFPLRRTRTTRPAPRRR